MSNSGNACRQHCTAYCIKMIEEENRFSIGDKLPNEK